MSEFFTEKQKNLISRLKNNELKRINILYGSVRSGKTWITLVVFAVWVCTMPKDATFIICGRTLTTLRRNCLDLLQTIVGANNFTYSVTSKTAYLFGRKVYLEGANDARSEGKIRGMTLQGAYVDEITLIDYDFFTMLLSRLSEPNAKLFGSTNPDHPGHWLKTEYFDRADELNIYIEKYGIDDNTFLDPEYVRQIKAEYTGVFYERFISGEFALAEGLIYPMFMDAVEEVPEWKHGEKHQYCLSVDYGTMNAFAALLWELHGDTWYAARGYYYSGRETGVQKTDEEYAQALDDLFSDIQEEYDNEEQYTGISRKLETIVDPSAASFITLLRRRRLYRVRGADNSVVDGIRETATAITTNRIKISPSIKEWQDEAGSYAWESGDGAERPIKVNDHYMDCTRYFVKTKRIAQPRSKYTPLFG